MTMPENKNGSAESSSNHVQDGSAKRLWTRRGRRPYSITNIHDVVSDGYSYVDPIRKSGLRSVRSYGSKRIFLVTTKHLLILTSVISTIIILGLVAKVPTWSGSTGVYGTFNHCNNNGSFTPNPYPTFTLWDRTGFFQITLFWGNYSFTQAKAIDVVWDVVIGRIVQSFLLWIAYQVFTKALARNMEEDVSGVSYGTFEALVFASPTFESSWILLRNFLTNRGWRARLAIAWVIIGSIYVLAFPTLVSAMSGYSTNVKAYMQNSEGNLIPWSEYREVQFLIHDAYRIGLINGNITDDPSSPDSCKFSGPQLFDYMHNSTTGKTDAVPVTDLEKGWANVPERCTLFWNTVQYASKYGLNGMNNTKSTFNNSGDAISLISPALNISSSYPKKTFTVLSQFFYGFPNGDMSALNSIYADPSQASWVWDNFTYDYAYVLEYGQCIPQATHNWGLSFLILFIFILVTVIWTIGMYAMWMDAHLNSRLDRAHRNMGVYRASYDFSNAMRKDMGTDIVTDATSNKELRSKVRRGRNGDRIVYPLNDRKLPLSRIEELKSWWTGVDTQRRTTESLTSTTNGEKRGMLDPKTPTSPTSPQSMRSPAPPYPDSPSPPRHGFSNDFSNTIESPRIGRIDSWSA